MFLASIASERVGALSGGSRHIALLPPFPLFKEGYGMTQNKPPAVHKGRNDRGEIGIYEAAIKRERTK
jgi:hypothetical protein